MKTKVFLAMCLLASTAVFGQTEIKKNEVAKTTLPASTCDKFLKGEFAGNNHLLIYSYLGENLEYPEMALKYNTEGTEVVQFTVAANGEVKNMKILNSVSPEIDEEVLKVLGTTSGMWKPGFINGQPAEMEREISMVFKINKFKDEHNSDLFKEQATVLFIKGSKALISQNNPAKAVKYFDRALKYMPNESTVLNSRGMAKYLLNDLEGAQRDWDRLNTLAERTRGEKNLILITENTSGSNR